eukprot:SAG31_NODE_5791_length_2326_cov_1.708128_2_plen_329_part_00
MDRALPDGLGTQVLLSTEGFGDLYNLHGDTALMSWIGYPKGSEISPARITMPSFVGCTYGPYENVGRAALDGWLLAGVSSPLEIGWSMLRETYASVFLKGSVTAVDPIATTHPTMALRLYDAGQFYLLLAAMVVAADGETSPSQEIDPQPKLALVALPVALPIGTTGIQTEVSTLVSSEVTVTGAIEAEGAMLQSNAIISVPLDTISATILPKVAQTATQAVADMVPAFIDVEGHNASTPALLTVQPGGSLVVSVRALAPWLGAPNASINVIAFGLLVNASLLHLEPQAWLEVSAAPNATPGEYLLRFASVATALPARRWVRVVANRP